MIRNTFFVWLALLAQLGCWPMAQPITTGPMPDPRPDGGFALDRPPAEDAGPYAGLVINEVAAQGSPLDWVEFYNGTGADLDLAGLYISDDIDRPTRATLAVSSTISHAGYLLVQLDGNGYPGFALGRKEQFGLFDREGRVIDFVNWSDGDSPLLGSYGRYPDGVGGFYTMLSISPGASNASVCQAETEAVLEPIWIAGGSGPRSAKGLFGKPDAIFIDSNGILLAGDEDPDYEELHLYDVESEDPEETADRIRPLLDFGADPGPGGDGVLEFRAISGIAQDPLTKKVYVVEQQNGRVQILKPAPNPLHSPFYLFDSFFGGFAQDPDHPRDGEFVRLQAIRFDSQRRIYLSDDAKNAASSARRDIQVFSPELEFLYKFGDSSYGPLGQQGNLQEPENFAFDELRDRIYVCDEGPRNIAIFRFGDRSFVRRLGGFLGTPNGVAIDGLGYLYAVDEGNDQHSYVRVFHPETLQEVFRLGDRSGSGDSQPGYFNSPDSLLIHIERDLLLVADQGHDRIQAFRLSEIQYRACIK